MRNVVESPECIERCADSAAGRVVRAIATSVLAACLAFGTLSARCEEVLPPAVFAQGELIRLELPSRNVGQASRLSSAPSSPDEAGQASRLSSAPASPDRTGQASRLSSVPLSSDKADQAPPPSSGTLPLDRAGQWVLVDDRAKEIHRGALRPGERALHFADLPAGGYFLFTGVGASGGSVQAEKPLPPDCLSFVVRPGRDPLPEDHFFAANQPDLAKEAIAGRTGPDSDYAFTFAAMKALGIRRLRTSFSPSHFVGGVDTGPNWQGLDSLVRDAAEAGVRVIAVLGVEPSVPLLPPAPTLSTPSADPDTSASASPAALAESLLRRYGFALDEFALCGQADFDSSPEFPPADLPGRIGSAYAALKHRSPQCVVALGDLTFSDMANARSKVFLAEPASVCDVLDYRADGSYSDFRRATQVLDRLVQGTGWEKKYRAVSHAGWRFARSDMSIATQRSLAVQTAKKLVWARYAGYRYFAAGRLLDPPPEDEQGYPLDDWGGAGFFSKAPSGEGEAGARRSPRLVAGAWVHALARLGGSRSVARLGFQDRTVEICGFEREGETVLVAWTPGRTGVSPVPRTPADPGEKATKGGASAASSRMPDAPDGRTVISLFWPEGAGAQVYDLMGRNVTPQRLRRKGGGERYLLVDPEPAYVVLPTPAEGVSW